MAENEQNVSSQSEGKQPEGQPTREETVPMSSYKKLQRDLQKTQDAIKALEAKSREGESVEAALERERKERAELERELKVERVKRTAPAELHDVIDNFVNKHGFVPDDEDLALLATKVKPAENAQAASTQQQSSGVRNSPAGSSGKPDFGDVEYLKGIKVEL